MTDMPDMADMKYLPGGKSRSKLLKWLVLGLVIFVLYVTLGNSTSTENLQQFVRDRSQVDVVRYSDYSVGNHSRVVIVRDDKDGRIAMAFVKVPFLNRWNLTDRKAVVGTETKPIEINIDDGFAVLRAEVSFDRVTILGNNHWSGTYAKSISIILFILLAIVINWWLGRYKQIKVV